MLRVRHPPPRRSGWHGLPGLLGQTTQASLHTLWRRHQTQDQAAGDLPILRGTGAYLELLGIDGPSTIDLSEEGQPNESATLDTVWAKYDELERLRDEMHEQLATLNDQISLTGEYCSLTGRLLPRPDCPYDADENDESEGGAE